MSPTSVSVSDAQTTEIAGGALSLLSVPAKFVYELIEASDSLAFQHLRGSQDPQGETQHTCQACFRGSLNNCELRHTSTCGVGRAIRAAWAMRAAAAKAEADQKIPDQEREAAARRLAEVTRPVAAWDHGDVASLVEESDESWEASEALLKPKPIAATPTDAAEFIARLVEQVGFCAETKCFTVPLILDDQRRRCLSCNAHALPDEAMQHASRCPVGVLLRLCEISAVLFPRDSTQVSKSHEEYLHSLASNSRQFFADSEVLRCK